MTDPDPQAAARAVEQEFVRIHRENMQGIPILNAKIQVQVLGFQIYQGRVIGVVITPWLMTVILLPAKDDDWSKLVLGRKIYHIFPAKKIKFLVNEFDGIGVCQTHSLHSPMNSFSNQNQAVAVAQDFIDKLMVAQPASAQDQIDEDLLGRIMRGEQVPEVNLDDFATIKPHAKSIPIEVITETKSVKKSFDRRSLLRGKFMESK